MHCPIKDVIRSKSGYIQQVKAQNGEPSKLYEDLLKEKIVLSKEEELIAKSLGLTEDIKTQSGKAYFKYLMSIAELENRGNDSSNSIEPILDYDFALEDDLPVNKKDMSYAQKKTFEKLMTAHNLVVFDEDSHSYSKQGSYTNYKSTSNFIESLLGPNKEQDYYKWTGLVGTEDPFEVNREWGNQVDFILENLLLGKDLNQVKILLEQSGTKTLMSEEVIEKLYSHFDKLFSDKSKVYVPQLRLLHDKLQIGSSLDVLQINQDGTVNIIDLKSSYKPFTRDFETASGNINNYRKPFFTSEKGKRASKLESNSAQLTLYAAQLAELGIPLSQTRPLQVLPVHLSEITSDVITNVNFERNFIPIPFSSSIESEVLNIERKVHNTKLTDKKWKKLMTDVKNFVVDNINNSVLQESEQEIYNKWVNYFNNVVYFDDFVATIFNTMQDLTGQDMEGNVGQWKGWLNEAEKLIKELKQNSSVNIIDSINKINSNINALGLYSNTLNSFIKAVNDYESNPSEKSLDAYDLESLLGRLQITYLKVNNLIDEMNELSKDNLADFLDKESVDMPKVSETQLKALENAVKEYNELLERTDVSAKYKLRRLKDYKQLIDNKSKLLENLYRTDEDVTTGVISIIPEGTNNKKLIKSYLDNGSSKDISWIEMFLAPMKMSSNIILSTFANYFNDLVESARQKSIKWNKIATKEYDKYKKYLKSQGISPDNVEKANEGFYQEIEIHTLEGDVKKEMHFVTRVDWANYYNRYNKMIDKLADEIASDSMSKVEANKIIQDFKKNNLRLLASDIKVKNPATGENVIIYKTASTIRKEKIQYLKKLYGKTKVFDKESGKEVFKFMMEFNNWLKEHTYKDNKGVLKYKTNGIFANVYIPKKINFEPLGKMSEAKRRYRDFLISSYFKSQENVLSNNRMGTRLPSIFKQDVDRVREQGLFSVVREKFDSMRDTLDARDEDNFGISFDNSVNQYSVLNGVAVPMKYSSRNIDAKDVSLDLLSSLAMYNHESEEYANRIKLYPVALSLKSVLKDNKPIKRSKDGRKVIEKVKGLFIQSTEAKSQTNYIHDMFEHFIESKIKLQTKDYEGDPLPIWLQKLSANIMGFQATTQVSVFKPLTNLANDLTARVNNIIEAFAERYVSKESLLKAEKLMFQVEIDMVNNFGKSFPNNKWSLLNYMYDPVKGEWKDRTNRKISQSALKRMASGDSFFWGQARGEWSQQFRFFLAMMNEKSVTNDSGEIMPMLDALEYDEKNNSLKLKDGFYYIEKGEKRTDPFSRNLQKRIAGLNTQMHGLYDKQDANVASRYTAGNLLLMYRKFLPTNLRSRYGGGLGYYDQSIQDWQTPRYTALFNITKFMVKDLKNIITDLDKFRSITKAETSPFSEQELYGAKRSAIEMLFMLSLLASFYLLQNIIDEDDDEKSWIYWASMYQLFRLFTEVSTYIWIPSLYRTFRTPTAAYSTIDKLTNLLVRLFPSQIAERYETSGGIAEKGELKLKYDLLRLIGYNGATSNPEEALKILKLNI